MKRFYVQIDNRRRVWKYTVREQDGWGPPRDRRMANKYTYRNVSRHFSYRRAYEKARLLNRISGVKF